MSAIDDKLKQLKEQELQLQREKRKVELLNLILSSTKDLPQEIGFPDVKDEVVTLLGEFVKNATWAIETGSVLCYEADNRVPIIETTHRAPQIVSPVEQPVKPTPTPIAKTGAPELSPNEKLNFALDNRHLGGKKVTVANDKNLVINGTVVGLDAPHVLVKTDTGPTIKVPLDNVSLA
jgi:hypothetical protein